MTYRTWSFHENTTLLTWIGHACKRILPKRWFIYHEVALNAIGLFYTSELNDQIKWYTLSHQVSYITIGSHTYTCTFKLYEYIAFELFITNDVILGLYKSNGAII